MKKGLAVAIGLAGVTVLAIGLSKKSSANEGGGNGDGGNGGGGGTITLAGGMLHQVIYTGETNTVASVLGDALNGVFAVSWWNGAYWIDLTDAYDDYFIQGETYLIETVATIEVSGFTYVGAYE
jgi:hypothetical protein